MSDGKTTRKKQTKPRKKQSDTGRGTYTAEQKRLVLERYQYCITRKEKWDLARELGMETLEQLYNLANRVGATRPKHGWADTERGGAAFEGGRRKTREAYDPNLFDEEDDEYLRQRFGKMRLEEIAYHRNHTESAMMYRARKLGMRQYCKYWQLEYVLDWLNITEDELAELGVDIYKCKDRNGKLAISLVSTSSLMRVIDNPVYLQQLESDGVDEWFLQEIKDLLHDHHNDKITWEVSRWMSHGHICLNPWAGESFMLMDNGTDHKMPAREVYPGDLI